MGLFERLGRSVEELRQEAADAREAEATHECSACGQLLYTDREDCPECGGAVVEREE